MAEAKQLLAEAESAGVMAEALDQRKIDEASPTRDALIAEFGPQYLEQRPEEWRYHVRHPGLTQRENDERGRRFVAMSKSRVGAMRERSFRRDAETPKVVVRAKDGTVQWVPAGHENRLAAKGFGAVVRWGRRRRRIPPETEAQAAARRARPVR